MGFFEVSIKSVLFVLVVWLMVIDVILFSEDDVLMKYILELCFKLFFFIKKIFKKMIRIKILR